MRRLCAFGRAAQWRRAWNSGSEPAAAGNSQTSEARAQKCNTGRFRRWLDRAVGCRIVRISNEAHDVIRAKTSPQRYIELNIFIAKEGATDDESVAVGRISVGKVDISRRDRTERLAIR